jgi:hypothetical protein
MKKFNITINPTNKVIKPQFYSVASLYDGKYLVKIVQKNSKLFERYDKIFKT